MHEIIYILTILFAFYVIDVVIGEQITLCINNVFGLNLSVKRTYLRKMLNNIKNIISPKS